MPRKRSTLTAVGTGGQVSNSIAFTYTPALVLTGLNPNQGPVAGGLYAFEHH